MKRYVLTAIVAALFLAAAAPASAQIRYRAYYGPAYGSVPYSYAPYSSYSYAPSYAYYSPGYAYRPYTSYYYSYPSGYAWGYPYSGYYGAYRVAPRYAYYSW